MPSLALVPVVEGSRSTASKTLVLTEALAPAKTPPKEPITLSESVESSSEEGTRTGRGSCRDRGRAAKQAQISKHVTKDRTAKRDRTLEPARVAPSPLVDKGKKTVEHLSSAPYNELLNTAEVTAEPTSASVTEMLC